MPATNDITSVFEEEPGLLGAMLDVCDALVLVMDGSACIAYANNTAQLLSPSGKPLIGESAWRLTNPATGQDAERAFFASLASGAYPATRRSSWGNSAEHSPTRLIDWHYNCIADASDRVRWMVGTGIDVTETFRAASATEDSQAHLRAVLDTAVDGIITINMHGVVRSFNAAAERMFGYSAREVIGQNVKMLMGGEYFRNHDQYLKNYLDTGQAKIIGIGREVEGLRSDGSRFPLELAVSEVKFDARRHFTGIVRDLTERRAAQSRERQRLDELAHASRLSAMGEMSSGIAHELNQPLAAIVTFAEACQRLADADRLDADTLRESLGQIAAQGQRAGTIVSRLRTMARKDQGERMDIDLNGTVRDVLALMTHDLRLNEVELLTRFDANAPLILADRVQIEQVILNLARNALDAMEGLSNGTGQLQINTRATDKAVMLEVLDNGSGLETDDPDQVFDSFFTTKAHGMGLGLSISRSIVEAHGGRLTCERRTTGGTRFAFHLPVKTSAHGS